MDGVARRLRIDRITLVRHRSRDRQAPLQLPHQHIALMHAFVQALDLIILAIQLRFQSLQLPILALQLLPQHPYQ